MTKEADFEDVFAATLLLLLLQYTIASCLPRQSPPQGNKTFAQG
jgi:hypothetical protein